MKNKTALILGVTGQDGAHLASHLLNKSCSVYGGFRRGSSTKTWRLEHQGILNQIKLVNVNIDEPYHLIETIQEIKPDYIFHVAGESYVADSFTHPLTSINTNIYGTLNILEAIRIASKDTRIFFASSSEVFGNAEEGVLLNEASEFLPSNPYAISKMSAQHLVKMYRDRYGLFASTGILFNHEGPLRTRSFVTRKITYNLARLATQGGEPFELGSFDSERDWGSAEDFTKAMTLILDISKADDFVFATGKLTSVRSFLKMAAEHAGFSPTFEGEGVSEVCVDRHTGQQIAHLSERYFRRFDTSARLGDSSKLKQATGWLGSRSLEEIIAEMTKVDIERWEKGITNV
jgi:GDPmannose 4,6-dehydratase